MITAILPISLAAAGTDWTLSTEGIGAGWALLLFLVACGAVLLSYRRFAPELPARRRMVLIALRTAVAGTLLILLCKPVLNLTLSEPVRQSLLVIVDTSTSMAFADKRDNPDDLKRAALAAGLLDPAGELKEELPPSAAAEVSRLTRWQLFQKLSGNSRLNLWPRLAAQSDLIFYQFGRQAMEIGAPGAGPRLTLEEASQFVDALRPEQPATAIGDALRKAIQDGRRAGAVLLVTDGANNLGTSPIEAAALARQENIPLFIYGVGVTAAPDVRVDAVSVPRLAFAGERLDVRAKIRTQGIEQGTVTVSLLADGSEVDQKEVALGADEEYEVVFHFVPEVPGDLKLEVKASPLQQEVSSDNNSASATARVTDKKFDVLLIEQEPRWDFRYLLAYLQRDRRLNVRAVMIDGEKGLELMENSPFLPGLPDDRESFFQSQVLILGDVNPKDLGEDRMETIRGWVEAGGGIIFLAGPNFDPAAYADTPLAPLLPVIPDSSLTEEESAQRSAEPFNLELTPQGITSSYLLMSPDAEENRSIWESFPGITWTAPVARAKPGAEVLLIDPRPDAGTRYGPRPVFAIQDYGTGTAVFIGTDATWRWRSRTGEKFYSILWGQIMQSLSLQLLEGGSKLTQLKTSQQDYLVGERVTIAGNLYAEGFQPLVVPSVQGTVRATGGNLAQSVTLTSDGHGSFRGDFVPKQPGEYEFVTERDPETLLKFTVTEPNLELKQTAMNERLLTSMAKISEGRFLREEDLNGLPDLIQSRSATMAVFKRIELYYSAWWMALLLVLFSAEWLIRRLSQLK